MNKKPHWIITYAVLLQLLILCPQLQLRGKGTKVKINTNSIFNPLSEDSGTIFPLVPKHQFGNTE